MRDRAWATFVTVKRMTMTSQGEACDAGCVEGIPYGDSRLWLFRAAPELLPSCKQRLPLVIERRQRAAIGMRENLVGDLDAAGT